jgi:hypothetical protein
MQVARVSREIPGLSSKQRGRIMGKLPSVRDGPGGEAIAVHSEIAGTPSSFATRVLSACTSSATGQERE